MTGLAAWDGLLHRRDVLRVGALTVGATFLPGVLAQPASVTEGEASAQSVILLWMAGGVTHIDSFDPKPDAPSQIRGTLGAIATTLPGVHYSESMPCLAEQAHRITVVRSFSHDSNDHLLSQAFALSGRRVNMTQLSTEPNVGAVVSYLRGSRAGFPGYIAVPGTTRPGPPPYNLFGGGWLGAQYGPFSSGGAPRNADFTARVAEAPEEEFHMQALQLAAGLSVQNLRDRQSLLNQLDTAAQNAEAQIGSAELNQQYTGAFQMLTAPAVRQAFDLNREPNRVRDWYGRTKIGQRCLLARRLVEAGAPFVMVDYGYDPEFGNLWDNHRAPVQNQPHICEIVKAPFHLAGTDRACAALVEDLFQRGLLDQTLVVFLTEFGRTPRLNTEGGRDHWGAAGSIFFAGGGAAAGRVIGRTDAHAAAPLTPPHGPGDVAATIYRALGIAPHTMLMDRQQRPLPVLPSGEPIPGVLA
jgi:uncharacterized protein (DUF1501 family)